MIQCGMSKKIDWDNMYKGALRGKRGKYGSYSEMMKSAREKEQKLEQNRAAVQKLGPELKKSLLYHMVNRLPIIVTAPFSYVTESFAKSSFETVQKTVPSGSELVYSRTDNTLGQFIFTNTTNGSEVEIYMTPTIVVPGAFGPQQMRNPGLHGLLFNTNIYQNLVNEA